MKLKLEVQEGITILSVTEDVQAQHGPILKAGIAKLFQSGKKSILLDLTAVTQLDEPAAKDIEAIRATAPELEGQLVVASPLEGLGQAPNREIAIKQINSPLFGLLATEAQLTAKLKRLDKQKNEFNEKLTSMKSADGDILKLRKENSDLKQMIRTLEKQVYKLLTVRIDSTKNDAITDRIAMVEKTVSEILVQDGVLSVKA